MSISKYIKNSYIICVFIFCFFPLPVRAISYWGDGIFAEFGFSVKASFPTTKPYEGVLGIRKTFDKAVLFAGGNIDDFGFTVAGSVQATALEFDFFSLGIKSLNNLTRSFLNEDSPDLITWGNVLLLTTSFSLGQDKKNPFIINANLGFNVHKSFLKLTTNTLTLQESSISSEFQVIKRFLNRHEIMLRLATFDTFLFKDFINLWWQVGYSFDLNQYFTIGGLAEVVYTDQIFLSGAMNGIQAKIFGVYKL